MLDQPYVPINLAALSEAGIAGEIGAQIDRGDDLLRGAGLKPDAGPWVDTASTFSQGDAGNLATGLQVAGATQVVISDDDLASGGGEQPRPSPSPSPSTSATASTVAAAAADSALERAASPPTRPTRCSAAEQLLAGLSFVHFENAFLRTPRGVVVDPPPGWQPSAAFMDTLLGGLHGNPALSPVTLSQLFTPGARRRQPRARGAPAAGRARPTTASRTAPADRIAARPPAARRRSAWRSAGIPPT